jgi:subtilisin family serine protease
MFEVSEYGSFAAGDTVFVFGTLVPDTLPGCPESGGLVIVDSILGAGPFETRLPGNFVMKIAPGADLEEILDNLNVQVVDSIQTESTYLISFADSLQVEFMLENVALQEGVVYAEPNFEAGVPENMQMSISFPDEEAPAFVRYASPTRFYDQDAVGYIDLDSAHQLTLGAGVLVAVIDNGFDLTHPLLADAIEPGGYDFLDDDPDPGVGPDTGSAVGHGTFVAGLVALASPESRILPLRAFANDGVGSSFAAAQAIYYAVEHGADVINMSFGQYEFSNALERACSSAADAGVLMVAAGGNDGMYLPIFPAALPNVIGVSALDTLDAIAGFSNFGDYIDVCAPGVTVYSSLTGSYDWGTWSGTSFSAALVTGACALAKAIRPEITPSAAETLMRQTADRTLETGTIVPPDLFYGYGRIDAGGAVWTLSSQGSEACGDADGSGGVDIDDAVFIINYVFAGGPEPSPLSVGDVDLSGMIDIDDITYLIEYVFAGGDAPCAE